MIYIDMTQRSEQHIKREWYSIFFDKTKVVG